MLCVVVLNYSDYKTTIEFVNSVINYEIIDHIVIVDNCSPDSSYEKLATIYKNHEDVVDVIRTKRNGGYGYGNNYGVNYCIEKYGAQHILISNPDVEVEEITIKKCLDYLMQYKECAVVSPVMLNHDMTLNKRCVWKKPTYWEYLFFSLTLMGRFFQGMYYSIDSFDKDNQAVKVGCVAGSLLMVDAQKMVTAGMYDENIFLYCEETVLGIKMHNAGFYSALLLKERFVHHHSVSINKSIKSKMRQVVLMWKSRLYVLNNYYPNNLLIGMFNYLIAGIALCETFLLGQIKKNTKKNKGRK
ncbi:MAG: glycosyltransferase [bacterium]|nr:glycosyltransferase [bacterium]